MQTILVVDDMAIFREPIEAVLRADGFRVLTASDGAEACAVMSNQSPDLVLLDLGMPVMDGLTVLRKMRDGASTKGIPVIVLSAEGDRAHVVQAAALGISGYLLKSQFSLKAMLESVQKTLATPPASASAREPDRAGTPLPAAPMAAAIPSKPAAMAAANTQAIAPNAQQRAAHRGHPGESPRPAQQTTGMATQSDLKSLRPLMTRSELLERINAKDELTGFSPTISQILKITSSEKCSMEQVAKAVSQDQATALKVMKLANSSVYSRGDRVDSVHKAVKRIGMSSIRQAVLNIGVVERFGSIAFEHFLSTPLFWEHSIASGIIAAELAHGLKHKEPDIAFTAGLLHDLGRVIYAERLGEEYVKVLEAAQSMQLPLEQVESRMLLMNHAEVMQSILHAWRFPKDLVNPIVFHHHAPGDIKSTAPLQAVDVLRLSLANRLAHALMLGSSGNDTVYPTEELCRILGVEPALIQRIEGVARQQTDDTKFALLTNSNGAAWPRHAERHRAALAAPFRPLYVSAAPESDAYRIFCDELAGPKSAEPPTVAIVHITAAKERAELSRKFASARLEFAVHDIPVMILSPGGQLSLDESAMANRRHRLRATPTPITQIIAAVNELVLLDPLRAAA